MYCVPECRYDRKETPSSDMVRSGLCLVCQHHQCLRSSQEEIDLQGAWAYHMSPHLRGSRRTFSCSRISHIIYCFNHHV